MDNAQFNVALPPSTVHLPKMLWVAPDVKCHSDTNLWMKMEGALLSFQKACRLTPIVLYTHSTREGVQMKRKRKIWMQRSTDDEQVTPVCIYKLIHLGLGLQFP